MKTFTERNDDDTMDITWKTCDGPETMRLYGSVAERFFVADYENSDYPPPLRNPAWKKIFVYGNIFHSDCTDSDFYGDCTDEEPEEEFPLAGRDHLAPLWRIAEEDGLEEVIVTEFFNSDQFATGIKKQRDDTYICKPDRENLEIPLCWSELLYSCHLMFPPDGSWVFFGDFDELCFFVGEPEFIDRFVEYYGGIELLQNALTAYIKFHSHIASRETWKDIVAYADWPWPEEIDRYLEANTP